MKKRRDGMEVERRGEEGEEEGKEGEKRKRKRKLTPTVSPTPFPAPLTVSPNQSKSEYTSFFFFSSDVSPSFSSCSSFVEGDVKGKKEDEPAPPVTPAAVPLRSPWPSAEVVSPTVLPRPLFSWGKGGRVRSVRGSLFLSSVEDPEGSRLLT